MPSCDQAAALGGSYGNSFWKKIVLPPLPFQTTLYFWKCSTNRPYAITLLPLTTRPESAGLVVQPAPLPWSARQAQMWSMMVLLLLTTSALVTEAGPAPPTRRKTSCTEIGSVAWLAVEPPGPTCNSDGDRVLPASKSRPASLTPLTSATLIAVTPLSASSVGKPRPRTTVSDLVTLTVWVRW